MHASGLPRPLPGHGAPAALPLSRRVLQRHGRTRVGRTASAAAPAHRAGTQRRGAVGGWGAVVTTHELRAQRVQRVTVLYAVMTCLVLVVSLQWVLLTVAVEGFLGD